MKLELKHLSPYLPYGLRFINPSGDYGFLKPSFELTGINYKKIHLVGFSLPQDLWKFKPILRPLSDLAKEIEVNGEKFVPIDKLNIEGEPFVEYGVNGYGKDYLCFNYADGDDSIEFNDYEEFRSKLLSWHFDVFRLIPQELAIDINTLKP